MKQLNTIKNYISSIKFLLLFIIFTSPMQGQGQQFMQAQEMELISEINCSQFALQSLINMLAININNQSGLNNPSQSYSLGVKNLCHGKVEQGINLLKQASDRGHITASYLVGLYYKTHPHTERMQATFQKPRDLHNAIYYYERAHQQIKSAPFYPMGPHIDTAYLEGNNSISAKIFIALPELYFDSYYENLHTTINRKPAFNQFPNRLIINPNPTAATPNIVTPTLPDVILPGTILKDMKTPPITQKKLLHIHTYLSVHALSKMQKSAEHCLQKGLVHTFTAQRSTITVKQLTIALNVKKYCESMKDFAEQALHLEFQRIKIARSCHTPPDNCFPYKRITSELQDLAGKMALYKTSAPVIK